MPYADVNATRLYFERSGSGTPLLLLHAATMDHRMWRTQIEALSGFDIVAYDLRGFGRSAPPGPPFKHCEDAAALLDHLGISRAIVAGVSIGAMYALELSFLRPELVAGLALLALSGLGDPPFPQDLLLRIGEVRKAAAANDLVTAKALWRRAGWFDSVMARPELAREVETMLADYSGIYWTASAAQNIDPPVAGRLEQVRVPTLVVDGGLDLAYNAAVNDVLARRIPDVQLLRLPNVGHVANMEDPDAVNAAIRELAKRVG